MRITSSRRSDGASANLQFYGVPPERVIEYRGHHADYVAVNYEVARGRSGRHDDDQGEDRGNGNGNGNGKGNGKGRGKH